MKRIISILLILALAVMIAACGGEQTSAEPTPTQSEEMDFTFGISLVNESSFNKEFIAQLEAKADEYNLNFSYKYAGQSLEQQEEDVHSMVANGAEVIFIEPVNVDEMTSILEYCSFYGNNSYKS